MKTTDELLCQSRAFDFFDETPTSAALDSISLTERGSIAEHLFDLWCMSIRVPCFCGVSNQGKLDRVIQLDGRFAGIQIKSGQVGNGGKGKTVFSIWSGNPWSGKKRRPANSDADILALVGMNYSTPSIEKSFCVLVKWDENLPQSIVLGGPLGVWPNACALSNFR